MNYANTLKVTRVEQNFTQQQLAEVSEVSQITISHIENGRVKPQQGTREKIEQILGPIDWIRTYDEGFINQPLTK